MWAWRGDALHGLRAALGHRAHAHALLKWLPSASSALCINSQHRLCCRNYGLIAVHCCLVGSRKPEQLLRSLQKDAYDRHSSSISSPCRCFPPIVEHRPSRAAAVPKWLHLGSVCSGQCPDRHQTKRVATELRFANYAEGMLPSYITYTEELYERQGHAPSMRQSVLVLSQCCVLAQVRVCGQVATQLT